MNELLLKLLEQTPVIIVLSISLFSLWNKANHDQKEHKEELKEAKKAHAEELKILNLYIRERDAETLEALQQITSTVENISILINSKFN
tara:strand:+ start:17291 stop:17557 length:267 start_codon:yes stop_codon:yes gene_type:complete